MGLRSVRQAYIAYKLLGGRVEKLRFLWFSFQFQLPEFSKGMAMYVDYFDALPNELKGPDNCHSTRDQHCPSNCCRWLAFSDFQWSHLQIFEGARVYLSSRVDPRQTSR